MIDKTLEQLKQERDETAEAYYEAVRARNAHANNTTRATANAAYDTYVKASVAYAAAYDAAYDAALKEIQK